MIFTCILCLFISFSPLYCSLLPRNYFLTLLLSSTSLSPFILHNPALSLYFCPFQTISFDAITPYYVSGGGNKVFGSLL